MSQTSTIMYVSKAHQQTVKRLYKIIFKLHKSLPKELEEIGNSYVRHEFKLHKNAKPEQVKIFMSEWGVSRIISKFNIIIYTLFFLFHLELH